MTRNFIAMSVILAIFTFFTLQTTFQQNFKTGKLVIENTLYEYTQIAAKHGCLSQSVFNTMTQKLNAYGACKVYITASRYDGSPATTPVVVFEGYNVVGKDLRANNIDDLTISCKYSNLHPLTAMTRMNLFMMQQSSGTEFRYNGTASGIVR